MLGVVLALLDEAFCYFTCQHRNVCYWNCHIFTFLLFFAAKVRNFCETMMCFIEKMHKNGIISWFLLLRLQLAVIAGCHGVAVLEVRAVVARVIES